IVKKRYDFGFVISFLYLTTAPVFELGSLSINSSYLLTALLAILFVAELILKRQRLPWHAPIYGFAFIMLIVVVAYTIGYLQHGTASYKSFAMAIFGEINVIVLVFLLTLLLLNLDRDRLKRTFGSAIGIFLIINIGLVIYQKVNFVGAYRFMDEFYVSNHRFKPLFMMWRADGFDRVMGSFFSPVLFGATLLLIVAVLLSYVVTHKFSKITVLATVGIMTSSVIGILSFSKTFMLGVPLIFLVAVVILLFNRRERSVRLGRLGILFLLTVAVYGFVYIALPEHMVNVKNYYYGFLLKPFGSLSSRYEGISESTVNNIAKEEVTSGHEGIATDAFGIFKMHRFFGVGPVPIRGEFLGDSQFIVTLHNGGLVAAGAYFIFYFYLFVQAFKAQDLMRILVIAVLAMGSFASTMLTLPSTLPFIALLIYLSSPRCPIFSEFNRRLEMSQKKDMDDNLHMTTDQTFNE
ncbi:MAG: hypothetical protein GX239_05170, partial [Clostridiaceae bacterium]|nr:hypothetical protein [Clostridiaceae bacterium]